MAGPVEYTKLAGAGNTALEGRLAFRNRAFLGSDHILLVRRSRYSESYRRLYLDDIQGVFYAETDEARTFNVGAFTGTLCAAGLTYAFIQSPLAASPVGAVLSLFVAAGLAIALILSVVRGASVRCWIRTARRETLVPNVGRLRAARRFAQEIENAVILRQGEADPTRIEDHLAALRTPLLGEAPTATGPERRYRLAWVVLLSEAAYAGMTMAAPEVFPPGFWILFSVAACAAVLLALFRGSRQTWRFSYRALLTAAAYYTTSKVVYWGLYWFLLTTEETVTFEIYPEDLYLMGAVTVAANGVMGLAGLFMPTQMPPAPAAPAPEPTGGES